MELALVFLISGLVIINLAYAFRIHRLQESLDVLEADMNVLWLQINHGGGEVVA